MYIAALSLQLGNYQVVLPTPAFYKTNKEGSSDGLRSPSYSSRVNKVRTVKDWGRGREGRVQSSEGWRVRSEDWEQGSEDGE